jgi:hypothetical protein
LANRQSRGEQQIASLNLHLTNFLLRYSQAKSDTVRSDQLAKMLEIAGQLEMPPGPEAVNN